ncbi:hypothetical protein KDA11_04840, partial [Candidatus Saccharibacteria bacterium]|nr:hypothetical protein [Candidatus Saccharibacteria bacterium]
KGETSVKGETDNKGETSNKEETSNNGETGVADLTEESKYPISVYRNGTKITIEYSDTTTKWIPCLNVETAKKCVDEIREKHFTSTDTFDLICKNLHYCSKYEYVRSIMRVGTGCQINYTHGHGEHLGGMTHAECVQLISCFYSGMRKFNPKAPYPIAVYAQEKKVVVVFSDLIKEQTTYGSQESAQEEAEAISKALFDDKKMFVLTSSECAFYAPMEYISDIIPCEKGAHAIFEQGFSQAMEIPNMTELANLLARWQTIKSFRNTWVLCSASQTETKTEDCFLVDVYHRNKKVLLIYSNDTEGVIHKETEEDALAYAQEIYEKNFKGMERLCISTKQFPVLPLKYIESIAEDKITNELIINYLGGQKKNIRLDEGHLGGLLIQRLEDYKNPDSSLESIKDRANTILEKKTTEYRIQVAKLMLSLIEEELHAVRVSTVGGQYSMSPMEVISELDRITPATVIRFQPKKHKWIQIGCRRWYDSGNYHHINDVLAKGIAHYLGA